MLRNFKHLSYIIIDGNSLVDKALFRTMVYCSDNNLDYLSATPTFRKLVKHYVVKLLIDICMENPYNQICITSISEFKKDFGKDSIKLIGLVESALDEIQNVLPVYFHQIPFDEKYFQSNSSSLLFARKHKGNLSKLKKYAQKNELIFLQKNTLKNDEVHKVFV